MLQPEINFLSYFNKTITKDYFSSITSNKFIESLEIMDDNNATRKNTRSN